MFFYYNLGSSKNQMPRLISGPVNQTLPIRTSASLPCQASGAHDAISWLKVRPCLDRTILTIKFTHHIFW